MKCLQLITDGVIDTDADTDSTTPVDMTTQDLPFTPGNDVVAAVVLKNVEGGSAGLTILIESSDTTAGADFVTVGTVTVGAAGAEDDSTRFLNIKIGQRLRASTNGATSAAGAYDVVLLSN